MSHTKNKTGLREWLIRVALVFTSTVCCFFVFNKVIEAQGSAVIDENGVNHMELNDSINDINYDFSLKNPYQFTDIVREKEKPDSVFRIAVLGDSFIWGYGIPYNKVWSHLLEKMVTEKYPNTEVLSWGFSGWGIRDQWTFMLNHGKDYNIDLLILGYVDNDANMDDNNTHMSPWWLERPRVLHQAFPDLAHRVSLILFTKSYSNWIDKVHSTENLEKYSTYLSYIQDSLDDMELPTFIVMTPMNKHTGNIRHFEKVIPYIEKAGMEYINLVPYMMERFKDVPYLDLMANHVNPHPGDSLNILFAEKTFEYLHQQGFLPPPIKTEPKQIDTLLLDTTLK